MIKKILEHELLMQKPPLLVDIGASGDIHYVWKSIAKYSICVAFDPDDRELEVSKESGKGFREFYLINRIVGDEDMDSKDFYLTNSPYCSSSLPADLTSLEPYNLHDLFEVDKKIQFPSITIGSALKSVGYDYMDWYKTDTQGTDLRIFTNIDDSVKEKILISEFEPGILDAYIGEDKLYKIMEYFDDLDFWCDDCNIKGMSRISKKNMDEYLNPLEKKWIQLFQKPAAFWAEISYMNQMNSELLTKRDFLLMNIFALIKKEYGFVIEICDTASKKYDDDFFQEISSYAVRKMKYEGYKKLPLFISKKIFHKVVG